jgi:hypothetical protein
MYVNNNGKGWNLTASRACDDADRSTFDAPGIGIGVAA